MPKLLIAYASKRGATAEIAQAIGKELMARGVQADVRPVREIRDISGYDAAVLGSAMYIGLWRKEAVAFLKKNAGRLAALPTWIFICGPTGEGDPMELMNGWLYPKSLAPVIETIRPRAIACFGGRIETAALNPFERWIVNNVKAPAGDYRDWDAVAAWAGTICDQL